MVGSFISPSEDTTEKQKGKTTSPSHKAKLEFKFRQSGFRTYNYCIVLTLCVLDSAYLQDFSLK